MRVLFAAGMAAFLFQAAPAQAHAILVESTPAISGTVHAGDIALRLRYNSRIDRRRSRLTLTLPDHGTETVPISAEGSDDLLIATMHLAPGAYSLRWQVLAIDGHITRGDVPFTVTGN